MTTLEDMARLAAVDAPAASDSHTICRMMKREIPLTRSLKTTVDAVDFRMLMKHKCHAHPARSGGWYARTKIDGRRVFMHALILGAGNVDHRDGNGLNNTRLNLRVATPSQNAANRRKGSGMTSIYKGVYLFRPGKYRAMICVAGRQVSLGFFADEVAAAKAYDIAAIDTYGEFASLNFAEEGHGVMDSCVAARVCPVHFNQGVDGVG